MTVILTRFVPTFTVIYSPSICKICLNGRSLGSFELYALRGFDRKRNSGVSDTHLYDYFNDFQALRKIKNIWNSLYRHHLEVVMEPSASNFHIINIVEFSPNHRGLEWTASDRRLCRHVTASVNLNVIWRSHGIVPGRGRASRDQKFNCFWDNARSTLRWSHAISV